MRGGSLQLFDSAKLYVFTFCLIALIAVAKVKLLFKNPAPVSATGLDINNIVLALITIYMAIYLAGLLRKLSSRIEQAAIVLVEVSCILWFASFLVNLGTAWAGISHGRFLDTIIDCAITILAGVRTFQVVWQRRRLQRG
jgi:hypothetical protein